MIDALAGWAIPMLLGACAILILHRARVWEPWRRFYKECRACEGQGFQIHGASHTFSEVELRREGDALLETWAKLAGTASSRVRVHRNTFTGEITCTTNHRQVCKRCKGRGKLWTLR